MFVTPISNKNCSFGHKISTASEALDMLIEKSKPEGCYAKIGDSFKFFNPKKFESLNWENKYLRENISQLIIKRYDLILKTATSISQATKGFTPSFVNALATCFPNLTKATVIIKKAKELPLPANSKTLKDFHKKIDYFSLQKLTLPDDSNDRKTALALFKKNAEAKDAEINAVILPPKENVEVNFNAAKKMVEDANIQSLTLKKTIEI
jgi:hypothetical protein